MTPIESKVIPSLEEFQTRFCNEHFQLLQWLLELRKENDILKSKLALVESELTSTMEMYSRLEKKFKEMR